MWEMTKTIFNYTSIPNWVSLFTCLWHLPVNGHDHPYTKFSTLEKSAFVKAFGKALCLLCSFRSKIFSHRSRLTNVQSHLHGLTVSLDPSVFLTPAQLKEGKGASVVITSVSKDHCKAFTNLPLGSSISLPSWATPKVWQASCCSLSRMTKKPPPPPQRGSWAWPSCCFPAWKSERCPQQAPGTRGRATFSPRPSPGAPPL